MLKEQSPAEFASVKIDDIIIGERAREVDTDWVKTLAASFREGEMLNPVTLWRGEDGPVLVAGLHRIEATKFNGDTHIDAKWSKAETIVDALILETSENLLRHELTALDRAHHLVELKEAYEAKYPETKGGVAGALAKHGSATDKMSFAEDAAEKTGLSERHIQRAVKMWKGLSEASKSTIKGTWLADHQAGLTQLAGEKHPKQAKALALIFPPEGKQPKATNVADALFLLENGRLYTSVEKRFAGLNKTIKSLSDEELDAVLTANEERIAAWFERHVGGAG